MNVSVITPVYNAAEFLQRSVESAVDLPEVGEVILVEDGSTDDSLTVCRRLARAHRKVRLFRHGRGLNRGAAASRNVGIRNARCSFISFLDADDFYLSNRFKRAAEVFSDDPSADGVYGAVGVHYWSDTGRANWKKRHDSGEASVPELTTTSRRIDPELLFFNMAPIGGRGRFHTDGIVVRVSVFTEVGLFHTGLRQAQDTNMWMKMAATQRLLPGRIDVPVAMRGMHDENRVNDSRVHTPYLAEAMLDFALWTLRRGEDTHKAELALLSWSHKLDKHQKRYPDVRWITWHRRRGILRLLAHYPAVRKMQTFKAIVSRVIGYYRLKSQLSG
jgi:glycosyltransferase involved in cell wall biosynthesis